MAQATISGTLDFGVQNTKKVNTQANNTDPTTSVKNTNTDTEGYTPSQLVFAANEDLGGGLKAGVVFSQRVTGGTMIKRDRHLTLSGGFGSVRLGTFSYASDGAGRFSGQGTTSTAGATSGQTNSGIDRQSNAMQYTTPNMNGFTAAIVHGSGSVNNSTAAGKQGTTLNGFDFSYASGPIKASAGQSSLKTNFEAGGGSAAGSSKNTATYIGGSYDLGVATVMATRNTRKEKNVLGATTGDVTVTGMGVMVPMGAVTLRASTYRGKNNATSAADDDLKLSGYQLGVTYALSKRTYAYAVTGENKTTRAGGNTTGTATKTTGSSIGLVHSF